MLPSMNLVRNQITEFFYLTAMFNKSFRNVQGPKLRPAHHPHQGVREKARRVRQLERGIISNSKYVPQ